VKFVNDECGLESSARLHEIPNKKLERFRCTEIGIIVNGYDTWVRKRRPVMRNCVRPGVAATTREPTVSNLLAILAKRKRRGCVECLILLVAGARNVPNALLVPFCLELIRPAA
jgi:hypothetical protein